MSKVIGSSFIDVFFLPRRGVLKLTSHTTKLSYVFNGSSKTSLDVCLNDLLFPGPNLLPELANLRSAWRLYKYVFVTDFKISPDDFWYQTVVWCFRPDDPIQACKSTTVNYGCICSSFLATITLRQLASDYHDDYLLSYAVIREKCFLDDMLSSGHSIEITI